MRPERMPCEAASIVGFIGEGLHQCCWEGTNQQEMTLNLDHVGPLDLTTIENKPPPYDLVDLYHRGVLCHPLPITQAK